MLMKTGDNKRKKIVVQKRKKIQRKRLTRKSETKGEHEDNPLLSRAPKSSTGAMMLQRHNDVAKKQLERQSSRHKEHGIAVERDIRNVRDNDQLSNRVKSVIKRFR